MPKNLFQKLRTDENFAMFFDVNLQFRKLAEIMTLYFIHRKNVLPLENIGYSIEI